MNPIDDLFRRLRAEKRKAFMPFVTAGDPDLAFTRELLPAVAEAGANLVEVGFPFSDPIADGPVIQASYTRALAKHLKLADVFAALKDVTARPGWSVPRGWTGAGCRGRGRRRVPRASCSPPPGWPSARRPAAPPLPRRVSRAPCVSWSPSAPRFSCQ